MLNSTVRTLSPYLNAWLDFQTWYLRVPGAQVCVRVCGEQVHSSAHGFADIDARTPLTPQHLMRIASHSKTFAAIATQLLASDGALRLDDTVARHCPEYADTAAAELTCRELVSHTAGLIRDGKDSDHWQQLHEFPSREELLRIVTEHGRQLEPGHLFKYSNIGFGVLGAVLQAASGMSFAELVRTRITQPLGLSSTYADYSPDIDGEFANTYSKPTGASYQRTTFKHVDTGALAAATGFVSTAEDVTAMLESLRPGADGILTDRQRYAMARPQAVIGKGERFVTYGLGTMTDNIAGRAMTGHSGGWTGTLSKSGICFDDGLAVSVITHSLDGPAQEFYTAILGLVELAERQPAAWQATATGDIDLDSFTGRYENPWVTLDVVRLGDRLVAIDAEAPNPAAAAQELRVLDANTVRVKDSDGFGTAGEDIHFTFDSDGQTYLRWVGEKHVRVATW